MVLFVLIADTPVKSGETTATSNWEYFFRDIFSDLYIIFSPFLLQNSSPSLRGKFIQMAGALSATVWGNIFVVLIGAGCYNADDFWLIHP